MKSIACESLRRLGRRFVVGYLRAAIGLILLLGGVTGPQPARAQLRVSGLLDAVVQRDDDLLYLNRNNTSDGNFDPVRTRLFLQSGIDNTQVHLQLLFSETGSQAIRVYGAYLMHKPFDGEELYVEVGKIPLHDGTWGRRSYSHENPLIGAPLGYYWKSSLPTRQLPNDLDDLLAHRGQGQVGIDYTDENGSRGRAWATAPLLYENCWNNGLYLLGTRGRVEYAVGATLGPPAAPVSGSDLNDDLSLHAKVGVAPIEEIKLFVSYAQGAYLSSDVEAFLAAGTSPNDFQQRVWIGSLEVSRSYLELHAEMIFNHFETPLRGDGLSSRSWYVEGTFTVKPGLYLAARYDDMIFDEVEATGGPVAWDDGLRRIETGIGYKLSRATTIKGVVQLNDVGDGFDGDMLVPALQASVRF